jgi:tryptophanyl-tRNA synthetase
LGNYLGAVKGMLQLQQDPSLETLFMVADVHTLTTPYKVKDLSENRREVFVDYLAAGLDPHKSILFIQSMVPEHLELAFYLSSVTTIARMQHLPTFKDKVKQYPEASTMALLNYPNLMAADILIYKASKVPVGIDQEPHLEIAREIARKMNTVYGTDFPEPERFITPGEYVPSLKGEGKMSKSVEGSYINLTDSLEDIRKRLATAPTDTGQGSELPTTGGVANLLSLVSLFQGDEEVTKYFELYQGQGIIYQELKEELAQSIFKVLKPIQEKRQELEQDRTYIDNVIADGAAKARIIATQTLQEVKKKMGLLIKIKPSHKPIISYEEFSKLDVRMGTVKQATIPEGSDKLIRTVIDFGKEVGERVIYSGIKEYYSPEELVGRQLPYVINLAPRSMMGEESQGMLMATSSLTNQDQHKAVLFAIDSQVVNGSMVI